MEKLRLRNVFNYLVNKAKKIKSLHLIAEYEIIFWAENASVTFQPDYIFPFSSSYI